MSKILKLIGHRGSGMDADLKSTSTYRRFHLAENTLLSFVTAGVMGANYVEFGCDHFSISGAHILTLVFSKTKRRPGVEGWRPCNLPRFQSLRGS